LVTAHAPRRHRLVLSAAATGGLAALALLATGQASAQQSPAGQPSVEAARQVTSDPDPVRLFTSPQIAVHPDDPGTAVVLAGDSRDGGCGLRVTRDGGLTWTTTAEDVMPSDLPHCIQRSFGFPYQLAFGEDGTLYAGLSGSSPDSGHPNGPVSALVARSDDLGETHDTFTVRASQDFAVEHQGQEYDLFEQNRLSSVAVDPTDSDVVYRGWLRWLGGVPPSDVPYGARPQRALVAVSTDGGETWTDPIDVLQSYEGDAEAVFGSGYIDLATGPQGTVYGFVRGSPAERGDPQPFYMVKSTDRGESWTVEQIHEGAKEINRPSVAISDGGAVFLAWNQRGDSEDSSSDIYVMASTDQGASWTEPVQLNDDDPSRGANQYFPGISVAANGRIDVAWYDFRNDPFFTPGEGGSMGSAENERWWDVYHTHSTDGGQTWSPNTRVTDRSVDGERGVTFANQDVRGPIGVASADSAAYVTWSDSRAASGEFEAEDAYFTRLRFAEADSAAGLGATPEADAAGWVWALLGAGGALVVGGLLLVVAARAGRGRVGPRREVAGGS
jgi:hypothetical protein